MRHRLRPPPWDAFAAGTPGRRNARIAGYPVPVVSLIDGLCMGGGLGLSVHGSFRVVTERAVLAMPETGIGFFPGIGASYFLPRLPGAIGMYLGLTGQRIDAADALYTGLATHFVPADVLDTAGDALADSPDEPVDVVLNRLAGRSPVAESRLAEVRGDVDFAFGASSLGEIDKRLRHLDIPWAAAALGAWSPPRRRAWRSPTPCWSRAGSARCASAWRPNSPSRVRPSAAGLPGGRPCRPGRKNRTPAWQCASLGGRTLPS
ncbi:enoyl-CoA hydratase/isomerase family protein [Streptomyces sp. NPDC012616]|uniref:enoyl-CoA hydratase/isomerase family protein n=1 Tax=Streptomyces sp. NPDC012616 TaxID=3364840 RepID=UPI0036F04633